eukprot:TRINITY_DN97663_c0_g1_i1.p1 TRINITY_DN97663_c0_g1~~TRINITY_DN97663_c0_g1_i1.p1  ORF type:complete len:680 (+),score=143.85 TRINITY_DN97663_c0_g1_i1:50-2041(+)
MALPVGRLQSAKPSSSRLPGLQHSTLQATQGTGPKDSIILTRDVKRRRLDQSPALSQQVSTLKTSVFHEDRQALPAKVPSASNLLQHAAKVFTARTPSSALTFHIVFLIDISRSMISRDVRQAAGKLVSRISAVWDAVEAFGKILLDKPDVLVSVVVFNIKADVVLKKVPLSGHGGLLQQLPQLRKKEPRLGGNYMPALQQLTALAWEEPDFITVGVMLSDGRPGDCPRTSLSYLKTVRQDLGHKCMLHSVMFGPEATGIHASTLKQLSETVSGTYYANEKLDATALQSTFCRLSASVSTLRSSVLSLGENALKQIPKKQLEAEDLWKKMSEEERCKPPTSHKVSGNFMLPDAGASELELKPKGVKREAWMNEKPFAEGAQRYAFHLWWLVPAKKKTWHFVVKESKFEGMHDSPQSVHGFFLKNHRRAQAMAAEFNAAAEKKKAEFQDIHVQFTPSHVVELTDAKNKKFYTTCEKFIDGKYVKYNANDGWVNQALLEERPGETAAAFSHHSFVASDGAELCVDIQGVSMTWTDPQLHSRAQEYGAGDLGVEGMKLFFRSHVCNRFCKSLGLSEVDADTLEFRKVEGSSRQAKSSGNACLLCLDDPRSVVCKPCGHLCLCQDCYKKFPKEAETCLVCRTAVKSVMVINTSGASSMHHSTYYLKA